MIKLGLTVSTGVRGRSDLKAAGRDAVVRPEAPVDVADVLDGRQHDAGRRRI